MKNVEDFKHDPNNKHAYWQQINRAVIFSLLFSHGLVGALQCHLLFL